MILLIDTFSVAFRAYYALPPMNTAAGIPTSALYGVSVLLLKLLREQRPGGVAFALEGGRTYRHDRLAAYKASRTAPPDPLRVQLGRLPELFDVLGVPAHASAGFEADDILATIAKELSDQGHNVLIVSGDRDLFQTVNARVDVMFIGRRGQDHVRYDVAKVKERYALSPEQLPSFVALTGDKSDNIPKLPGVGSKIASRWLEAHGDIAGVLAAVDRLEPLRLRAVVRAHAEQLRSSEAIARLRTDAPLSARPLHAPLTAAAIDRLRIWFEELEFSSLLRRLDALEFPSGHPV